MKHYDQSIICGSHYPTAKVVRRLTDYLELVEYPENTYRLVTQHGHLPDDALVTFAAKPYPDPDPDCEKDDCPEADQFANDVEELEKTLRFSPGTGHFLYNQCVELGFTTDQDPYHASLIQYWLFHTIGTIVQQYELNNKTPEQPTT